MKIKDEKGSITTVVTVTILFCIVVLSTAYAVNTARRSAQLKSQISLKETYEQDKNNIDEIAIKLMIPEGFYYVGGNKNTGLVISDSQADENKGDGFDIVSTLVGNQYVWVDVPNDGTGPDYSGNSITKKTTYTDTDYNNMEVAIKNYTSFYRNSTSFSDIWYSIDQTGLTSAQYTELKQKTLKSIFENGGFWVGRYEAGDETATQRNIVRTSETGYSDVAVTKAGQYPYQYLTCRESQYLASTMAPKNSKYSTNLMFGFQWDLLMKFIEVKTIANSSVSLDVIQQQLTVDSSYWGNFINSNFNLSGGKYNLVDRDNDYLLTSWVSGSGYTKISSIEALLTTGISARNCKMNIYDLASNSHEFTLEYTNTTTSPCAYRGGGAGNTGTAFPANGRAKLAVTGRYSTFGFRAFLLI